MALRTTTLNSSTLKIKASYQRIGSKKKERYEEQLFSNKEGVATIATHGDPELSKSGEETSGRSAKTLMPNTREDGPQQGRPNVTPLDNVATIMGTISILRIRMPENQRLEKSEPFLGCRKCKSKQSTCVRAHTRKRAADET